MSLQLCIMFIETHVTDVSSVMYYVYRKHMYLMTLQLCIMFIETRVSDVSSVMYYVYWNTCIWCLFSYVLCLLKHTCNWCLFSYVLCLLKHMYLMTLQLCIMFIETRVSDVSSVMYYIYWKHMYLMTLQLCIMFIETHVTDDSSVMYYVYWNTCIWCLFSYVLCLSKHV